ncbi:sigma-54 dependent transcriptional regulator [Gimesia sp.]|uniref:sigma-54 dependent transcriptional regulator n=1 Tax=Gimesia sp. TaxID=2024833 RepID=UPI0025BE16C7|nr:sigma-54 dependent transcriptional regulator [Gimesia sp.]|tara:strand:+ start:7092 stop:8594 length:1503 start_codon:yes stop_codon:yes gene_type:complete
MELPTLILVTRDTVIQQQILAHFKKTFQLSLCSSLEDCYEQCSDQNIDSILVDLRFLLSGGHQEDQLLEMIQSAAPETEIILLTEEECPEILERRAACTAMMHIKGFASEAELLLEIDSCLNPEEEVVVSQSAMLNASLGATSNSSTPDNKKPAAKRASSANTSREPAAAGTGQGITRRFETNSHEMKLMLNELEIAAQHDVTVLLIGETGAGKTYLSRLIHDVSPRRNEPFLNVACGALPNDLIESELFGHVRGAFTSAHADKDGKFLAAGRGTVLLDEIDVLGPEQQVKLLRVIETGEFEPIGSNKTHVNQARLVVASNMDLQPLVEQGKFRPDLYYRLNMLKFDVLPLRRRKSDIIVLANDFVHQMSIKHKIPVDRIDEEFMEALHSYPWPGNVRELENVIRRSVIYCREGVLRKENLPSHILMGLVGPTNDPSVVLNHRQNDSERLGDQVAVTEKELIEQALFKNNYSRTNTAKTLGISRVTLYNKMKKYGMNTKK